MGALLRPGDISIYLQHLLVCRPGTILIVAAVRGFHAWRWYARRHGATDNKARQIISRGSFG